jgi:HD-GYP domain-containing protein (c-di-GMP phosphodiesterase class II)
MILGRAPLPNEIAVGRPLPWAIHDRHGTLLLKQGEVIRSEDLLRAVLTRGIVRESDLAPAREREREPLRAERDDGAARSVFRRVRACGDRLALILIELHGERCREALRDCLALVDELQALCDLDLDAAIAAFQVDASEHMGTTATRGVQAAVLAELLGRGLALDPAARKPLIGAALTHDLGMHALSDTLNRQKLVLSPQQRDALHLHPEVACERLLRAGLEAEPWLDAVRQHHERIDGSGYPDHLGGERIGMGARILAVIDTYTAMIRPRAYRDAVQSREALRQLFLERGRLVDESLAATFIRDIGVYPPGTFVRLHNAEVAVVTRRGPSAATPQLKTVVSASGVPTVRAPQRDSRDPDFAIVGAVPTQRYRSVLGRIHELWDEDPARAAVA